MHAKLYQMPVFKVDEIPDQFGNCLGRSWRSSYQVRLGCHFPMLLLHILTRFYNPLHMIAELFHHRLRGWKSKNKLGQ